MKHSKKVNNRLELGEYLFKLCLAVASICVVVLGSVLTASADDLFDQPIALTEDGFVIGTTTNGVNEFLGIPYAAPPVGPLRWIPPKPYGSFHDGFLQATQFGSECPQFDATLGGPTASENCLFLNVYTPKDADDWALPVMVWIHGGGLTIGSGALYDPTRLVKKGVIVVTINYRLGLLGFFAQSALDAEGHLNANYGLMDQQFALKWVRRNIAAFGGDPRRVTIFGESAGGESVQANLASPTAAGLFQRAIAESGSYFDFQDYLVPIVTVAQGETIGSQFVPPGTDWTDYVGCGSEPSDRLTAACLRGVPASTLVAFYFVGSAFPFVDGTILTQTLGTAFASGQFNHVPVISGGNHDEWRLFVADEYDLSGTPLTDAEYAVAVAALETAGTPAFDDYLVNVAYPLTNYPPPPDVVSAPLALGALGTDELFACPELNADTLLSQYVTTYTYEFNDENAPPAQSLFGGLLTFPLGAYHTAELQYLFNGDFFGLPVAPLSPAQERLSDAMISYWTQFAKTGDPNSPGEPRWSPYSSTIEEFQSLVPPKPKAESNFDGEHQCSVLWNTF